MIVLLVVRLPELPVTVEAGDLLQNTAQNFEGRFISMQDKTSTASINTRFLARVRHPAERIGFPANEE